MKTRRRMKRILFAFTVVAAALLSSHGAEPKIRPPAVAGLFYPDNPAELSRTIDQLLASAKTERTGELKALICPHAGYPFSGPVAASGFKLLRGLHFDTVVVLGPSHYAFLDTAAVSDADAFRTPLGEIP